MPIAQHILTSHASLDLAAVSADDLHVVRACGRNLRIALPPKWTSLWMPLSGTIEIGVPDCTWTLPAGKLLVWRDSPMRVSGLRPGWWLALCGSAQAWSSPLGTRSAHAGGDVFPQESECPRPLRRLLVRTARQAWNDGEAGLQATFDTLGVELAEHQRDLHALVERCNGRTLQRRRQTLLRLLWVRHLIEKQTHARLDLAYLSASASYSACHLIRSYRDVFGETPTEYASRLRAERAWRLVRDTRMPVCEITEALGFESQSAFCRAFKNIYGMTASQARQRCVDQRLAA